MKKQMYSLLAIAMMAGFTAQAQPDAKAPKVKTEKKEITINADSEDDGDGRKKIVIEKKIKNGKEEKMVIVVDGETVTINGKPAKDFNGNMHFFKEGEFDGDINVHVAPNMMSKGRAMFRNLNPTQSNKAMLGVVTEKNDQGAKVTDITNESAAAKAGIKEGDIIVGVNSDKISDENNLVKIIGKYKPDENVDVIVLRDGKEKKLKAKLGKNDSPTAMTFNWNDNENFDFKMPAMPRMPATPRAPKAFNFDQDNWPLADFNTSKPKFGFSIADNEDGDGVKITGVKEESNAAKAGLKEGDLITEANGTTVKNTDELKKQLAELNDKNEVPMKILRNRSSQSITVKVPKKIKTADL